MARHLSLGGQSTPDVTLNVKAARAVAKNDLVCLKESGRAFPASGLYNVDITNNSAPVNVLTYGAPGVTVNGNPSNGPFSRRPSASNASGVTIVGAPFGAISGISIQRYDPTAKSWSGMLNWLYYGGSGYQSSYAVFINNAGKYGGVAYDAYTGYLLLYLNGTQYGQILSGQFVNDTVNQSFDATCLADDTLAVLYRTAQGVYVQRYDMTTGGTIGSPITLHNVGSSQSCYAFCLRARRSGGFLATWYNSGQQREFAVVTDGTYSTSGTPIVTSGSSSGYSGMTAAGSNWLASRLSAELSDGRLVFYSAGSVVVMNSTNTSMAGRINNPALSVSYLNSIVVNEDDEIICSYSTFNSAGAVFVSVHRPDGTVIVPSTQINLTPTPSASFNQAYCRIDTVCLGGRFVGMLVAWYYNTYVYIHLACLQVDGGTSANLGVLSLGSFTYGNTPMIQIVPMLDGSIGVSTQDGNATTALALYSMLKSSPIGVAKTAAAIGASTTVSTVGSYTINQNMPVANVDRTSSVPFGPKTTLIGTNALLRGF